MRTWANLLLTACITAGAAHPQPSSWQDPFLDCLAGTWVMKGTIAGRETTHDVQAAWVLGHQYLRLQEVSQERDSKGQPAYEAIVFLGWDADGGRYTCLWLDNTGGGGLSAQAMGHGKREQDRIPFSFQDPKGEVNFRNTFVYDKDADAWLWVMDNIQQGKERPFARLRLTKR